MKREVRSVNARFHMAAPRFELPYFLLAYVHGWSISGSKGKAVVLRRDAVRRSLNARQSAARYDSGSLLGEGPEAAQALKE